MFTSSIRTLVIAPHPDDETLGVGGTLLRRKKEGAAIAWCLATCATINEWPADRIDAIEHQIAAVANLYQFDQLIRLDFPSTKLDTVPMGALVDKLGEAIRQFQPSELFVPHPGDIHSDHRVIFEAAVSCTKWFRYPSIRRVLAYETLSETDFSVGPLNGFTPNVFIDISKEIDAKLSIASTYATEIGEFPFPRSREAIKALASLRGAASGSTAAEGFYLIRERS